MTYFFHIVIGLIVIVFQTAVLPQMGLFAGFYDLIIVQTIYLGLYRPLRQSLVLLGLFGLAMDSLTGGPYGVYLTTYFWIFGCVRWALSFFRLSDTLMTPLVVALCVIVENLVHLTGVVSSGFIHANMASAGFHSLIRQLIWAILTGPMVLVLIKKMDQRWVKWSRRLWAGGKTEHNKYNSIIMSK